MNIIIQTLGFKGSAALEGLIREKLAKVDHHAHGITQTDVILTKGPESEVNNCYCEIKADMRGTAPFVKKHCETFEQAIAEAVIALEAIINKNKDKEISKRHEGIAQ